MEVRPSAEPEPENPQQRLREMRLENRRAKRASASAAPPVTDRPGPTPECGVVVGPDGMPVVRGRVTTRPAAREPGEPGLMNALDTNGDGAIDKIGHDLRF